MAKIKKFFGLALAIISCLTFGILAVACAEEPTPTPGGTEGDTKVEISYSNRELTIDEAKTFDYKLLFSITDNGVNVKVQDSMLSLGGLDKTNPAVGEYKIKLIYKSVSNKDYLAKATVIVKENPKTEDVIVVEATQTSLEVFSGIAVSDAQLLALFKITENGNAVTVTMDMLDLKLFNKNSPAVGSFTISCTYKEKRADVTILVEDDEANWIGPY